MTEAQFNKIKEVFKSKKDYVSIEVWDTFNFQRYIPYRYPGDSYVSISVDTNKKIIVDKDSVTFFTKPYPLNKSKLLTIPREYIKNIR